MRETEKQLVWNHRNDCQYASGMEVQIDFSGKACG
jgi:hypothetical protein